MSQPIDHFRNIDPNNDGGTVLAQLLNDRFSALLSAHSGAVAPSYAGNGTQWLDTSATPPVLKLYIAGSWVPLGTLDLTTHAWTPAYLADILAQAQSVAAAQAVAAAQSAAAAAASAASAAAITTAPAYARTIGGVAYRNILGIVCAPTLEWRAKDSEALTNGIPTGFTFTRASTAYRCNALGLLESIASGALRHDYDPVTGEYLGWLREPARTNIVLYNRDLTNAAWVKTSMTAAKDQQGTDGVAASCSSLLATGANATCLQTITSASSARATSAYIKRLVGTGAVYMTTDGGTTWTDITAKLTGLGPNGYARVALPGQTLANPVVGIKLGTSGDKVGVDFVQSEATSTDYKVTTPNATTSASATRAADLLTLATSGFVFNPLEGTLLVSFDSPYEDPLGVATNMVLSLHDGTINNRLTLIESVNAANVRGLVWSTVGGSAQVNIVALAAMPVGVLHRLAMSYKINNVQAVGDGGAVATAGAATIPAVTTLEIGGCATASPLGGHIRALVYFPRQLSGADITTLTR